MRLRFKLPKMFLLLQALITGFVICGCSDSQSNLKTCEDVQESTVNTNVSKSIAEEYRKAVMDLHKFYWNYSYEYNLGDALDHDKIFVKFNKEFQKAVSDEQGKRVIEEVNNLRKDLELKCNMQLHKEKESEKPTQESKSSTQSTLDVLQDKDDSTISEILQQVHLPHDNALFLSYALALNAYFENGHKNLPVVNELFGIKIGDIATGKPSTAMDGTTVYTFAPKSKFLLFNAYYCNVNNTKHIFEIDATYTSRSLDNRQAMFDRAVEIIEKKFNIKLLGNEKQKTLPTRNGKLLYITLKNDCVIVSLADIELASKAFNGISADDQEAIDAL